MGLLDEWCLSMPLFRRLGRAHIVKINRYEHLETPQQYILSIGRSVIFNMTLNHPPIWWMIDGRGCSSGIARQFGSTVASHHGDSLLA